MSEVILNDYKENCVEYIRGRVNTLNSRTIYISTSRVVPAHAAVTTLSIILSKSMLFAHCFIQSYLFGFHKSEPTWISALHSLVSAIMAHMPWRMSYRFRIFLFLCVTCHRIKIYKSDPFSSCGHFQAVQKGDDVVNTTLDLSPHCSNRVSNLRLDRPTTPHSQTQHILYFKSYRKAYSYHQLLMI